LSISFTLKLDLIVNILKLYYLKVLAES